MRAPSRTRLTEAEELMKLSRKSCCIALVSAALLAVSAPANAAGAESAEANTATVGLADVATGNGVTAACSFAPALVLGPGGGLQVAFDGTATAANASTIATNITCTVKTNSGSYGSASLALPGLASAVAGVSNEIPLSQIAGLRICAYGTAFLQGGATASSLRSSGC